MILGVEKAHIIDFKTDRAGSADELTARHRNQLGLYREMVARVTGITESGIRCSIVSTCLKSVIDI